MARADAQRNREAILRAARALFVERGIDVALDAVAQQAGVSIATLYRNFADRQALIREVAMHGTRSLRQAALDAGARIATDAEAAWLDFAVTAAELRAGVLMPMLLPTLTGLENDTELAEARTAAIDAVDDLVVSAQRHGQVRADVSSVDVMAFILAVARPLPVVPADRADDFTRRALHVTLAGLRPGSGGPMPGTALPLTAPPPLGAGQAPAGWRA